MGVANFGTGAQTTRQSGDGQREPTDGAPDPPFPTARPRPNDPFSDQDILVAPEVARLLRMNVKTVYELAKAGALPCLRLGRHFRFSRRAIVAHLGQCKPAPYREGK
ncbi:MAG: helix-turn-helix domain-containing protein [Haliangium ochraceum]